jgi:hypothetical protein
MRRSTAAGLYAITTAPSHENRSAVGERLLTIHDVVEYLNAARIRATYGAVADVTGGIARGIGARVTAFYKRRPEASWVVNAKEGTPSGHRR